MEDVTTWVFEVEMFVPAAKIKGDKRYSIVTDYLGTPIQMYDEQGEKTWDCTLDVYGKMANFEGSSLKECPFRYQGQYEDKETGLYYNRFRYYSAEEGMYISQDPIRVNGGHTLYSYVHDTNGWVDIFGLSKQSESCERGLDKAKKDLENLGLTSVTDEVTMIVNGQRVRADLVFQDGSGNLYVVEVKNNTGKLTDHQSKSNVYNTQANSGGSVDLSKGTNGTFTVATDNRGEVGRRGESKPATFVLVKYED